jgi:short-subunit dehydrogenase
MEHDDVVVITGASSGIGLECARAFYQAGYRVVMAARSLEKLETIQVSMNPTKLRVAIFKCDVSVKEECKALIDFSISTFGTVHVLINNAGVTMRSLFQDAELHVLRQIMETNLWGAIYCTHYAMPELLKNKGSVVGISSVAGYKGLPTRSGYSASKFALEGFLETLRIENLNSGVHVLIARPGFTATNIRNTMVDGRGTSQGASHKNEEKSLGADVVARAILKGVQKRKDYIMLSTTAYMVFWINKFFRSWLDRQMFKHVAAEKDTTLK